MAQKGVFDVGVVEGGEKVEDPVNLLDASRDGVAGKGNIPNRCAEEREAVGGGPRNTSIERVLDSRVAAPDEGLGGIEEEAVLWTDRSKEVEGAR